jgi:hypothetical protein
MAIMSSGVSRLSGVTRGFFSFMARLIQLISEAEGCLWCSYLLWHIEEVYAIKGGYLL